MPNPRLKPIGTVVHYFDKIGVGVLKLNGTLKVGDTITLKRNDDEFSQPVESLQVDHENIPSAKKGDDVGLKLEQPVKEGTLVFKA